MSVSALFTGHIFDSDHFSLSLFAPYDKSLGAVGLFSFLGQTLLVLSLFNKRQNNFWIKLFGLFLLWLGFYYLTHNFFHDDLSRTGFFVGIPFLISSGLLTYKMIYKINYGANESD